MAQHMGKMAKLMLWVAFAASIVACGRAVVAGPPGLRPPITPIRSTRVPPPTPTPTPDPRTDLIVNGSFESDDGWSLVATEYTAAYVTEEAHRGLRSARCGIVDQSENVYSYSAVCQWVVIPQGAITAQFDFWLYAHSLDPRPLSLTRLAGSGDLEAFRDAVADTGGDLQYVLLLLPGQDVVRFVTLCDDAGGWEHYSFDLSEYAGQRVGIHFEVYNDGADGVTSMHVDDVALLVE